jgi:putative transposase
VTNQGVDKMPIFLDEQDMREFLARLRNYLSPQRYVDASRRPYAKLGDQVCLLAYCLMLNHFHLVIHQISASGMSDLMRRTMISYGKYFNVRHGRCGPMFRDRYAAKPVETIEHAQAAIAYTHLNEPIQQLDYVFSSHELYMGSYSVDWVDTTRGLGVFGGADGYERYMNREGPKIVTRKMTEIGASPDAHPFRPIKHQPRKP